MCGRPAPAGAMGGPLILTPDPKTQELIDALCFLMKHPKYGEIGAAADRDRWREAMSIKRKWEADGFTFTLEINSY